MQSITVTGQGASAIQLVTAGSGLTLLTNSDAANTVYLGDSSSANPNDPSNIVPLGPTQSIVIDGRRDVWGMCSPGKSALIYIVPGGVSFFQLIIKLIVAAITPGSGIFVYDGLPMLGDLITSITAIGGTDPQGNPYPAGVTVGENSSTQVNILSLANGNGIIQWLLNQAAFNNPSISAQQGVSPSVQAGMEITGPQNNTPAISDYIAIDIFSGATGISGQLSIFYIDANNFSTGYLFVGWPGAELTGSVTGVNPGTGTSASNPAIAESWHAISLTGGPPGVSGFARIKHLAESNFVLLDIEISYTVAAGNTLYTIGGLPTGYYPAVARHVAIGEGGTITGGANPGRVFVPTSGGIQIEVNTGSSSLGCQAVIALD